MRNVAVRSSAMPRQSKPTPTFAEVAGTRTMATSRFSPFSPIT